MTRKHVEERTLKYHQSGLCCTEAIIRSITEIYSEEPNNAIPKIGSGFCKGIGKTGEDICGTLVGGVMALGVLFGRMNKDGDNSQACEYSAEFRNRFIAKHGTTNCYEILNKFGEQEKMGKCKTMTADAAGMIADMLSGK
ncbi:MAG: C-GCAxxG-C-C family protein [Thermodesulfobacteriota bacterium]|nr:C-GCAxxG-C-C family protein [Thermodesulfobacteriota bacterium]